MLIVTMTILRSQIKGRMLLSDAEKATLAEIAHRLGRKAVEELAAVAKPDTLLAYCMIATANTAHRFVRCPDHAVDIRCWPEIPTSAWSRCAPSVPSTAAPDGA